MEERKFVAALFFTVLLLNSYVHLSTAASGRKMLEVHEEKTMGVARILNAANMKDYDPVEANPKHDPHRDPDLEPPTDPHHHDNPPHEADPPREADPPTEVAAPPKTDRSSIYHHVHHQHQPHPQIQTPVNIPAPAPTTTTIQDGV